MFENIEKTTLESKYLKVFFLASLINGSIPEKIIHKQPSSGEIIVQKKTPTQVFEWWYHGGLNAYH